MNTLWMKISNDNLELPEAVACSVKELSIMTGYSENNIRSKEYKRRRKGKKTNIIRVEIDDEEEVTE